MEIELDLWTTVRVKVKVDSPSTPGPGEYAIPSKFDSYKRTSLPLEHQQKSKRGE